VEDDVFMDIRIYYAKILHNFLNFCGKTISVSNKNRIALEDYIIRGSDQKWCIRNYPSLRYHQVDISGINLNENTDKSKDIVNTQLRVLHDRCVEIITN